MLINLKDITLRTDEDTVWIAGSHLLPGYRASGETEVNAVANFQEAAKAHLEALKAEHSQFSAAFWGISHRQMQSRPLNLHN